MTARTLTIHRLGRVEYEDGLTLECFRAPGEAELRLLAEQWRAPDGSPAQPDALEEALRLSVRSARAAHALHALLLRWWASR